MKLTKTQRVILSMLADGATAKFIASHQCVGREAIAARLAKARAANGCNSTYQLLVRAAKEGHI